MVKRAILVATALAAAGLMWILPAGVIPFAARIVGLAIVGGLCFALGATRGRRPDPSIYSREPDAAPAVRVYPGTPVRALPQPRPRFEDSHE